MKLFIKLPYLLLAAVLTLAAVLSLAVLAAYFYIAPALPDVETLREVKLQVPLRIYTRDGRLMAEFGEQRRLPVRYEQLPQQAVDAFLAAEDDRFFEHPGVDYQGLTRAVISLAMTGERRQGGGTITMQLARNFFLTREKTYVRKIKEIFLALRIETELSKQEILTLYLNKIFLGQRAYGIAAAGEVYYGKDLDRLSLAEIATIAGLPKAPSRDNPITSPQRARERRAYVLRRMRELGKITPAQYEEAMAAAAPAALHGPTVDSVAPYVAEQVRVEMLNRYGRDAYNDGYEVTTTLDSRLQSAAVRALRQALLEYDRRHGFRGPVARAPEAVAEGRIAWLGLLETFSQPADLHLGLVTGVGEKNAELTLRDGRDVKVDWSGLAWARAFVDQNTRGPEPKSAGEILVPGDVVYLIRVASGKWELAQLPEAQGAMIAIDPRDGAIVSLTGGFDYYTSKYNRAVQARRQPGSSFKPFIYSAALERGFTAASLINDAPVVFQDAALEGTWRPENYSGRFYGPTRLREALIRSRNMVSIRLLREIGVGFALDYVQRFGFPPGDLPRNLSLALGSATVTPLQIAQGYTVFANGGYRTEPYFIDRIRSANGEILFEADPAIVCEACEQTTETGANGRGQQGSSSLFSLDGGASEAADTNPSTVDPVLLRDTGFETALADPRLDGDNPMLRVASRAIPAQNAYLITDLMRDVVRRGTGVRAYRELKRGDMAGKTGTTNDRRDAWFSGFTPDIVATAWVGFDKERSLGRREEGGRTALPMWIYFMREATAGLPEASRVPPGGLVTVRISPETGLLASAGDRGAVFETFRVERVPTEADSGETASIPEPGDEEEEPLF